MDGEERGLELGLGPDLGDQLSQRDQGLEVHQPTTRRALLGTWCPNPVPPGLHWGLQVLARSGWARALQDRGLLLLGASLQKAIVDVDHVVQSAEDLLELVELEIIFDLIELEAEAPDGLLAHVTSA